ncbi:major facilitator superfamily domain-containing protein [Phascolomyces articulosus]|uniref:Major facilitator superfamily domain-containing protein n=1 Tax=Phascolomyces articulosus TaxID=60185 RepID=A0AAD5JXZ7_9FUNG|nr:major facilitator superfamily domain-containing protein [Phascolomyces articulosus]
MSYHENEEKMHDRNDEEDTQSSTHHGILLTDEETAKDDNSISDGIVRDHHHHQHHEEKNSNDIVMAIIENDGQQQQQQPYCIHSRTKKLLITIMVSSAAIISPFSGTIYYPALTLISEDFDVSISLINISVTVYMVFQAVSPSFWGPCSDIYGRRPIYLSTMTIFIGVCIALANAPSYPVLLVLRMLQSFSASSTIAIGAGVIGDITTPAERGAYYSIYTATTLSSTAIGPVVGGVIADKLSWRWVFWILLIIGAVTLITVLFFLPETLRAIVGNGSMPINLTPFEWIKQKRSLSLSKQQQQQQKPLSQEEKTVLHNQKTRFKKIPNFISAFMVLRHPDVILIMLINGCFMAMLFTLMTTTSTQYPLVYTLDTLQVGLCYIPYGVGSVLGSLTTGRLLNRDFMIVAHQYGMDPQQVRKTGKLTLDFPIYLARLRTVWIYMVICQLVILVYGWVLYMKVHLAIPLILLFIAGITVASIMNVCQTLVIDLFPGKTASITAKSNFVRSLFGALITATIQPGIERVGLGWIFTIIGLILTIPTGCVPILIKFGPRWWRERIEQQEKKHGKQEL